MEGRDPDEEFARTMEESRLRLLDRFSDGGNPFGIVQTGVSEIRIGKELLGDPTFVATFKESVQTGPSEIRVGSTPSKT
jgi:hypothetical protein